MRTLRKLLLPIGKVLLAIALGVVAMVVVETVLGVGFGLLSGLFSWPVPTPTTRNLIALAIFVIGLLIYREKRASARNTESR